MTRNLDILIADSSGNITIMVLTPVPRDEYKQVAQQLLDMKKLGGEQVAFVLPESDMPSMEMCGLEFCGNASRAFAFYEADRQGLLTPEAPDTDNSELTDSVNITVKVSGCDHPLTADIISEQGPSGESNAPDSTKKAAVEMEMPVPSNIRKLSARELSLNRDGLLVDIDGISHLILEDIPASSHTFEDLQHYIYENIDPELPAFGVMFCDTVNQMMTPVVYVKDVDSTYFEGSCASGTVAASFALVQDLEDGIHEFTMQQPEGMLHTTVNKKDGQVESISLKGLVSLSDIISVTID